ncbi:MAG: hypothetical protein IKA84_03485 [Clostridia bacterium]|nr:hypothetical protein [Clostridia bacterium]
MLDDVVSRETIGREVTKFVSRETFRQKMTKLVSRETFRQKMTKSVSRETDKNRGKSFKNNKISIAFAGFL